MFRFWGLGLGFRVLVFFFCVVFLLCFLSCFLSCFLLCFLSCSLFVFSDRFLGEGKGVFDIGEGQRCQNRPFFSRGGGGGGGSVCGGGGVACVGGLFFLTAKSMSVK